jgi:hypothetical protein
MEPLAKRCRWVKSDDVGRDFVWEEIGEQYWVPS